MIFVENRMYTNIIFYAEPERELQTYVQCLVITFST